MKAFHAHDGYAITQILPKLGITPVILTGRTSEIVRFRAKELGIVHCHQGFLEKLPQLKIIAGELGAAPEEIAYIGDDLNDLPCMEFCGITGCPADAVPEIQAIAQFRASKNGGNGAVREFIHWLSQGAK